jgi:hypothetical protein
MKKAPSLLAPQNLKSVGAFLLLLLFSTAIYGQQKPARRGALQFSAGGSISLQNFNTPFAQVSSLFDISEIANLLGSTDTVGSRIGFGGGHGWVFDMQYLHNQEAKLSWLIGTGLQQRTLNVYSDYARTLQLRQQAPYFSLAGVYTPIVNQSNRLQIQLGLQAQFSSTSDEAIYTRTDSLGNIPFLGNIVQTSTLRWEQSGSFFLMATAGLNWVSRISEKSFINIGCRYQYSLQDQFRYAGSSRTENPLFPLDVPVNSSFFRIDALHIQLGFGYLLKPAKRKD